MQHELNWTRLFTLGCAKAFFLPSLNPESILCYTLETIYAKKTNISFPVEIVECMFVLQKGDDPMDDHFGCLHELLQEHICINHQQ